MSPMMPMGGAPMGGGAMPMSPEEELMGGGAPMGPPPVAPGMAPGGDPMMDETEPAPEEIAQMLGAQIGMKRDQMHAMVDQAAEADLQNVLGMVAAAAQGAQVMGPGQIA